VPTSRTTLDRFRAKWQAERCKERFRIEQGQGLAGGALFGAVCASLAHRGQLKTLSLTYAGADYWDRTLALQDGSVAPDGVALSYRVLPLNELFRRMVQDNEFDACEMSLSTFISLLSRGDRRFVGLPVFPSRSFRHGYIFVNANSGIREPADLRGRMMGIPEYQMTAALWIRAFLQHDYGILPSAIRWRLGGLRTPGYAARTGVEVPSGIDIELAPADRHLESLLDAGEIDALMSPFRPYSFMRQEGKVRRLFPEYVAIERAYYARTGVFPIMHIVIVRRGLCLQNPWLAQALTDAFAKARQSGLERMRRTGQAVVGLPWLAEHLEETETMFGSADPWACERAPNEAVLAAACEYAFEQGLAVRRVAVDELFATA
jgi:4,5-dihydroxyphthalate decarboxylase